MQDFGIASMNNVALVTVATQQQVCTRRTMQPTFHFYLPDSALPPLFSTHDCCEWCGVWDVGCGVWGVGCGVWGGVRVCAVAGVHPSRVSRAAVMIRFHANSETLGLSRALDLIAYFLCL